MPSITVNTDTTARSRAAALVPIVQVTVPSADLNYLYDGAAGIGLKRICSTMPTRQLQAADLTPVAGSGVAETTFPLSTENYARALVKATALGMTTEQIVGAAVRTGLSLLSSVDPGPFTTAGLSRQFLPPLLP